MEKKHLITIKGLRLLEFNAMLSKLLVSDVEIMFAGTLFVPSEFIPKSEKLEQDLPYSLRPIFAIKYFSNDLSLLPANYDTESTVEIICSYR